MCVEHDGAKSKSHIIFKGPEINFLIGDISSESGCPGIPLDPRNFRQQEMVTVDWVEIEIKNEQGKLHYMVICPL